MADLEIVTAERAQGCVHHWVLGDPVAGQILGTCRRCKATRTYPASPESTQRFDDYRELMSPASYNERLSA